MAAVAVFPRCAADQDTATTVEAVESGWWYTSAIPGARRVVALLTDGDLLPAGIRHAERFVELVATTRHVASLVDGQPEPPTLVAAGTAHLDRPVGRRMACRRRRRGVLRPTVVAGHPHRRADGRRRRRAGSRTRTASSPATAPSSTSYRTERMGTYALEQRWPDSPFWSRRRHRP